MNGALNIWDYLTRVVIFLLFIAGLLVVAVWYLPLIKHNERMRKEILRYDAQIQKQEEAGKQLKASIDALRYDPKAVERLARETMGYAKPGETVIKFEEPVTNRAAGR
jgi:cell division protein FtsB